MKLANKVALITGAGSGMGKAAALLFASEGAAIAAVDVDEAAAMQTARLITESGRQAIGLRADVSREADAEAMVAATVQKFGGLDILYNNAGIEGEGNLTHRFSAEGFDKIIAINLRGVFLGMKFAIPQMLARGGGSIINTASTAGLTGVRGGIAYCASKHAVIGMTKTTALEYAHRNIRVNCICPGPIETPLLGRVATMAKSSLEKMGTNTPLGRLGKPEEIARMALFLASDDSSYASGAPFIVDGAGTAS